MPPNWTLNNFNAFAQSLFRSTYFDKGRFETNFKYDKELTQSVKIMQDKNQVAAILKGDGDYKVIGKPQFAMVSKKAEDDKDKDTGDQ